VTRLRGITLLVLAGCAGPAPEPAGETAPDVREPIVVTRWSARSELFMEYPALQVGASSRFAIHLTDLDSFRPLASGRVAVEFDHGDGFVERFAADSPTQAGIFGVTVKPARAGMPSLAIRVQSPALQDLHQLGPAEVLGEAAVSDASAADPEPPDAAATIAFLKEQQWTMDFATEVVESAVMQQSLRVPASVEPRSGGRVLVTAPVAGRLLASVRMPGLGTLVERGQMLGSIIPLWVGSTDRSSLQLTLDEARVALENAKRQRARVERLLAVGAIPERRLEEAKAGEDLALARLAAAEDRMAHYEASRRDDPHRESLTSFSVRSHLAGVVIAVHATEGAHLEEGDVLLEVAATDMVHVSAAVPEAMASVLGSLEGAEVELADRARVLPVKELVSTAMVVDPQTRTLKATYLVDNSVQQLAIGQSVFVRLFTSQKVEAPTVPDSALVDDGGRTVVYVQTGGEAFERRQVEVGNRSAANVQVTAGVRAGDRIVTKGAYLLRLSSLSPQAPGHGHVH